ncbi:thyrotroph embryonic factor isoform X2 [Hydra vulgaris]|uniref:Thyrotroph embryonic factor isoform X2 n=1 Tax=Hydra vulgaris TaxID=6087 RepID=A0ABM4BRK6_HYDVU
METSAFLEVLNEYVSQNDDFHLDSSRRKFQPTSMNPENLTARHFSNMTDKEMLNYFIPVKGIDYDQNCFDFDECLKKESNNFSDFECADKLMLHKAMPELNPLYKYNSGFKAAFPFSCESYSICSDDDEDESNATEEKKNQDSSTKLEKSCSDVKAPRVIKKRKPRTYKYNPKPLLHKDSRSFVPDNLKDIEYWERRKRNNEAAKKSREERRKKELEILANYDNMKKECADIKVENVKLKAYTKFLEQQVDDLKKKLKYGGNNPK